MKKPNKPWKWKREWLEEHLMSHHRNILPIDDVWGAVRDLDADRNHTSDDNYNHNHNTYHNITLFFSGESVLANPKSPPDWGLERLWPAQQGMSVDGPEITDVHNIRPSYLHTNHNNPRQTPFFGACGLDLFEFQEYCHPTSRTSNFTDGGVYLPPAGVRGDIARVLFYMELRYPALRLTDCPQPGSPDMAYLSQLLAWHAADPVDETEVRRNDRACSRWQGNRNPFVDFPELVESLVLEDKDDWEGQPDRYTLCYDPDIFLAEPGGGNHGTNNHTAGEEEDGILEWGENDDSANDTVPEILPEEEGGGEWDNEQVIVLDNSTDVVVDNVNETSNVTDVPSKETDDQPDNSANHVNNATDLLFDNFTQTVIVSEGEGDAINVVENEPTETMATTTSTMPTATTIISPSLPSSSSIRIQRAFMAIMLAVSTTFL